MSPGSSPSPPPSLSLRPHLEEVLVARQPLYGREQVGGQTQPLAEGALLKQGEDLLELGGVCLVAGQRLHGQLELTHVHAIHIEELQLQGVKAFESSPVTTNIFSLHGDQLWLVLKT